jgi:3,4-dihydroxy 2-butanone 4-phosphate synthase/GTP cyclohydrolase II
MAPWIPSLPEGSLGIDPIGDRKSEHPASSIAKAALELKAGRPVIVIGGQDGHRSGQLVFAAQLATPATVAFAVRHSSGILCAPMTGGDCDRLDLPAMQDEGPARALNFTVSVDAVAVESTGISATDRACTIGALAGQHTQADAFTRPGHVFPIRTVDGGVLHHPAHPEAAVDLTRIAGLRPIAVSATLVNDHGSVSGPARLRRFAKNQELRMLTIDDLIAYRLANETHVKRNNTLDMQRPQGDFTVTTYTSMISNHQIAAISHGDIVRRPATIRHHRECTHGSLFGAPLCTCAEQLDAHLRAIANAESGVLIYTSSSDARRPDLFERLGATTTLGSLDEHPGDVPARDRHLPALRNQVLQQLGVEVPDPQVLTRTVNPSLSLTWLPSL